jgi:hypothetical protein
MGKYCHAICVLGFYDTLLDCTAVIGCQTEIGFETNVAVLNGLYGPTGTKQIYVDSVCPTDAVQVAFVLPDYFTNQTHGFLCGQIPTDGDHVAVIYL